MSLFEKIIKCPFFFIKRKYYFIKKILKGFFNYFKVIYYIDLENGTYKMVYFYYNKHSSYKCRYIIIPKYQVDLLNKNK